MATIPDTETRIGIVPEFLPARQLKPEPARRIPFWRAFFFRILFPQWNPHLAAAPMSHALAANVLAQAMIGALGFVGLWIGHERFSLTFRGGRAVFAEIVMMLMSGQPNPGEHDSLVFMFILMLPILLAIAAIMIGVVLTPAMAAGDEFRSVLKRSINDALWTTTALVPVCAAVVGVVWIRRTWIPPSADGVELNFMQLLFHDTTIAVVAVLIVVLLLMRSIGTGAGRYVGPATGPGFRPRRPQCEDCGYVVGGLPIDTRCPECELPVRDSMPTGRRAAQMSRLSALSILHPLKYAGFWAWMLMHRDAMRRLPMRAFRMASQFWWIGYSYAVFAVAMLLVPLWFHARLVNDRNATAVVLLAVWAISGAPLLEHLMEFVMSIVGRVVFGIKDIRISIAATRYASVMLGPLGVLFLLQAACMFVKPLRGTKISLFGYSIEAIAVPSIAIGLMAIYCLLQWIRRCIAGLRSAAFANS